MQGGAAGGVLSTGPHANQDAHARAGVRLWGEACLDMSEAQLRALFPSAQAPFAAVVNSSNWLQMKGPAMDGEPSTVTFYFKEGSLDSVRWAPERKLAHGSAQELARWLERQLVERHGAADSAGKTPDLWGSYTRHVWFDRGTKIVLHLHVTHASSVPTASLWVTYSAAP
jgi:hypothetical protein